jgi:hypothetical protein
MPASFPPYSLDNLIIFFVYLKDYLYFSMSKVYLLKQIDNKKLAEWMKQVEK